MAAHNVNTDRIQNEMQERNRTGLWRYSKSYPENVKSI